LIFNEQNLKINTTITDSRIYENQMAELRNEIANKILENPEEYSRADKLELSEEIEQIRNKKKILNY
jgi:hypothetical protein